MNHKILLLSAGTTRALAKIYGICFCLVLMLAGDVSAQYHALLVGVGKNVLQQKELEGPEYDVQALKEVLLDYNIPSSNIVTLVDEQATKNAILRELDNLYYRTEAGDKIMFYFSGHGTSSSDIEFSGCHLPDTSGALVPYDINLNEGKVNSSLIIGKRDVRPRLLKLDRGDRLVFAVFDSCYSGQAVRSFGSGHSLSPVKRYLPLGKKYKVVTRSAVSSGMDALGRKGAGIQTGKKEAYPYKNVFYISAASEFETALDIPAAMANSGRTADGRPHGVLTENLLITLRSGNLDSNNDGRVSMSEMYKPIKAGTIKLSASMKHAHTPNALPERGPLHNRVFFNRSIGSPSAAAHPLTAGQRILLVQVDAGLAGIKNSLAGIGAVKLVSSHPFYRVQRDLGNSVVLLDNRNQPVIRYASAREAAENLPDLLYNRSWVLNIVDKVYPNQRNNVSVDLKDKHGNKVFRGDRLSFSIEAEKDAYMLLLNITPAGLINIITPWTSTELVKSGSSRPVDLDNLGEVVPPYGLEVMKLVAFSSRPQGIEKFFGKSNIQPGTRLYAELEQLLGISGPNSKRISSSSGISQHTIRIISYSKDDIEP